MMNEFSAHFIYTCIYTNKRLLEIYMHLTCSSKFTC